MLVSEKWLREWVSPDISTTELCDQLTAAGLEVEGLAESQFSNVVVGEITSVQSHSSNPELFLCDVSDGERTYNVVCGAKNVREGLKSALAKVGAALPGDSTVEEAIIRGSVSEAMLCSESDLGLSHDHSGILELDDDAPLGEPLDEVLDICDQCIDLYITPNRGDCFSIRGIAREIAVLTESSINPPVIHRVEETSSATVPIRLDDPQGCPIYLGRIVDDIDVNATVPQWLTRRLNVCGIRGINAVVDVLNYVMLELGQPMHAFDLDHVLGGIVVRRARRNETLTLLDGTEAKLDEQTLLITSGDRPVAIAGVVGGLDSGVSATTNGVLLECAFFSPLAILGTARKYGLQTDASTRYERGVDFQLQEEALERATALLVEIAGGRVGPVIPARSDAHTPTKHEVQVSKSEITRLIGDEISDDTISNIFTQLEFNPSKTSDGWQVTSPSHRFDIAIEEDLVEEVCRIYGYDRIASRDPHTTLTLEEVESISGDSNDLRLRMKALGYNESITFSFIDPVKNDAFTDSDEIPTLQNPMSPDKEVMRCSLVPGLLDVAYYNIARQSSFIRVFEHGQCFNYVNADLEQRFRIAGVAWGFRSPEVWAHSREFVDFYDVKGDVERLLPQGFIEFRPSSQKWLQPGQGADIFVDDILVGSVGKLSATVQKLFKLEDVYAFECDVERLKDEKIRAFSELSEHPSVRRDLALVLEDDVDSVQIEQTVKELLGDLLVDFTIFDLYKGKQLGDNKKSLAIGMTLQDASRTLEDADANLQIDRVVKRLQTEYGAELR